MFLRTWRPKHLLWSWIGYWIVLALLTLGPAAFQAYSVAKGPGNKGSVSAGVENSVVKYTVINDGVTLRTASARVSTVALWLGGPPLLLWIAWLLARPRRGVRAESEDRAERIGHP
jgi:hypothetical protein